MPRRGVVGNHQSNPIEIEDDLVTKADEEIDRLRRLYEEARTHRPSCLRTIHPDDEVIDIESLANEELVKETSYIDLTDGHGLEEKLTYGLYGNHPNPSPIISDHEVELHEYETKKGLKLRKGMTVELKQHIPRAFGAQFFKITAILFCSDAATKLRGYVYTRTKNLRGILGRQLNEVVLIAGVIRNVVGDIVTDWNRQAMIDIDPDLVLCERVLRTTNCSYPEYGFDADRLKTRDKKWIADNEVLVCRWQYVRVFKTRILAQNEQADEWLIRRITEDDADEVFAVSDEQNLNKWRGGKIPGGSVSSRGKHESPVIDLDSHSVSAEVKLRKARGRKYNAGDAFSGAGGASRGLVEAGIVPFFAVDNWDTANKTYRSNFESLFKGLTIYEMDIFNFITNDNIKCKVDILHMSPPCQYWSPAHTISGKQDDQNQAALFACGAIVNKVRPRIFTIEQTFGMLFKRFEAYFKTLIGAFTSNGYSVRWKIVHFSAWGLCSKRRRLIVVGSAPGEQMPELPRDTHFERPSGPGQQPFVTVGKAMSHFNLVNGLHRHDEDRAYRVHARPWDPYKTLLNVITCKGGDSRHWSGKRKFTVRELACLQGFPLSHTFKGPNTDCVKQIGNAVPPLIAKRLFQHIVRWLQIQDDVLDLSKPDNRRDAELSMARQRLERIKFVPEVSPRDNEVEVLEQTARAGASPTSAINLVASDEGEESCDDPTTSTDKLSPTVFQQLLSTRNHPYTQGAMDVDMDDDTRSDSSCTAVEEYEDADVLGQGHLKKYQLQPAGFRWLSTSMNDLEMADGEV